MTTYYLEQGDGGPFCPNSHGVMNEIHRQWIAVQNAAYDQTAHLRDSDHEYDEAGEAEYARLIREGAAEVGIDVPDRPLAHYEIDRMRLYGIAASVSYAAQAMRGTVIQTFYFQCQVCGFVLPAGQAQ